MRQPGTGMNYLSAAALAAFLLTNSGAHAADLLDGPAADATECKVINTELDGSTFLCGESAVGVCSADAVFSTGRGDLYLSQVAVSDSDRRAFTEINRVLGGTGLFDGASGTLFISGTSASSALVTTFESTITGSVCLMGDASE